MTDAPPRILIVEDDLSVVQGLLRGLRKAGFDPSVAMDGARAPSILQQPFDLVLLDLMLPERSGAEILEAVSTRTRSHHQAPRARTSRPDCRASRWVRWTSSQPFFMEELVARIRVRLALTAPVPSRQLALDDVVLDLDARRALREGHDLGDPHEFNILAFLRERAGRAVTRAQLAEHALPEHGERTDRTVDSHLSRIRKKLGPSTSRCIRTVWGIGYTCDLERV